MFDDLVTQPKVAPNAPVGNTQQPVANSQTGNMFDDIVPSLHDVEPNISKFQLAAPGFHENFKPWEKVIITTDGKNQGTATYNPTTKEFVVDDGVRGDEYHPESRLAFTPDQVKGYRTFGGPGYAALVAARHNAIPTLGAFSAMGATKAALQWASTKAPIFASKLVEWPVTFIGGAVGAGVTGKLQDVFSGPLSQYDQDTLAQHHVASFLGGTAPAVALAPTSPTMWKNALGGAPTAAAATLARQQIATNAALMTGMGVASDAITPGSKVTWGGTGEHLLSSFLMGNPNRAGRLVENLGAAPINMFSTAKVNPSVHGFDAQGNIVPPPAAPTAEATPPPAVEPVAETAAPAAADQTSRSASTTTTQTATKNTPAVEVIPAPADVGTATEAGRQARDAHQKAVEAEAKFGSGSPEADAALKAFKEALAKLRSFDTEQIASDGQALRDAVAAFNEAEAKFGKNSQEAIAAGEIAKAALLKFRSSNSNNTGNPAPSSTVPPTVIPEGHVPPMPEGKAEADAWVAKYGKTHEVDGTPLSADAALRAAGSTSIADVVAPGAATANAPAEVASDGAASSAPSSVADVVVPKATAGSKPRYVVPAPARSSGLADVVAPVNESGNQPVSGASSRQTNAENANAANRGQAGSTSTPLTPPQQKVPQGVAEARALLERLIAEGKGDSPSANNAREQIRRWEEKAPKPDKSGATADAGAGEIDPKTGKKIPQGVVEARKRADELIAAGQGESPEAKHAITVINRWESQNGRPLSYQKVQPELGQQPRVEPTTDRPEAKQKERSSSIRDAMLQIQQLEDSLHGKNEKERRKIQNQIDLRKKNVNADDVRNGRTPTYEVSQDVLPDQPDLPDQPPAAPSNQQPKVDAVDTSTKDAPPVAETKDVHPVVETKDVPPVVETKDTPVSTETKDTPATENKDVPPVAETRDAPASAETKDVPPAEKNDASAKDQPATEEEKPKTQKEVLDEHKPEFERIADEAESHAGNQATADKEVNGKKGIATRARELLDNAEKMDPEQLQEKLDELAREAYDMASRHEEKASNIEESGKEDPFAERPDLIDSLNELGDHLGNISDQLMKSHQQSNGTWKPKPKEVQASGEKAEREAWRKQIDDMRAKNEKKYNNGTITSDEYHAEESRITQEAFAGWERIRKKYVSDVQTDMPLEGDTFNLSSEKVNPTEEKKAPEDTATGSLPGTKDQPVRRDEPVAQNEAATEEPKASTPESTPERDAKIEAILKDAEATDNTHTDRVVPSMEFQGSDGKWYGGSVNMPMGVSMVPGSSRQKGWVFRDKNGRQFGQTFETKAEAEAFLESNRSKSTSDMRESLAGKTDAELGETAEFWKKRREAFDKQNPDSARRRNEKNAPKQPEPAATEDKPKGEPKEKKSSDVPPVEGKKKNVKKSETGPVEGEPIEVTDARERLKNKSLEKDQRKKLQGIVDQFENDQKVMRNDHDADLTTTSDQTLNDYIDQYDRRISEEHPDEISQEEHDMRSKVEGEILRRVNEEVTGVDKVEDVHPFLKTLRKVIARARESGIGIPWTRSKVGIPGEIRMLRENGALVSGGYRSKSLFHEIKIDSKRYKMDSAYRDEVNDKAWGMMEHLAHMMHEEGYDQFGIGTGADGVKGGGMRALIDSLGGNLDDVPAGGSSEGTMGGREAPKADRYARKYDMGNAPKTAAEAVDAANQRANRDLAREVPEVPVDERGSWERWADNVIESEGGLGQANSGIDPTQFKPKVALAVAVKGMTFAARKIKGVSIDFAEWSKDMVGEFGNGVKPYLESAWEKMKDPNIAKEAVDHDVANLDLHAEIAEEAQKQSDVRDATDAAAAGQTPTPSKWQAFKNLGPVAFFRAVNARLRSLKEINSQSQAMKEAVELVTGSPDSPERDLQTAWANQKNVFANRIAQAMKPLEKVIAGMTPEAQENLQKQMIKMIESGTQAQGQIGEALKAMKATLEEMHTYANEAGLDVGHVKDYFPRGINANSVIERPGLFVASAEKAYEAKWRREHAAESAKNGMPVREPTSAEKLDFKNKAIAWKDAVVLNEKGWSFEKGLFDEAKQGNKENFQRERLFSKEEAKHLEDFRDTDVWQILGSHIHSVVKRAELARRFGANGEKYKQLQERMKSDGVDGRHKDAYEEYLKLIMGYTPPKDYFNPSQAQSIMNGVNLVTTVKFLQKTPMLIAAEPAGITHSTGEFAPWHHAKYVLKTLGNFANILERADPEAIRETNTEIEKVYGRGHDIVSVLAQKMGVTAQHSDLIEGHAGIMPEDTDVANSLMKRILHKIHNGMFLSQMEQAKRETAVGAGMRHMETLSDHATGNDTFFNIMKKLKLSKDEGWFDMSKVAKQKLTELGVPEGEHANFTEFVNKLRGMKDKSAQLEAMLDQNNPMAKRYRNAVELFSKRAVVQTTTGSRTAAANEGYLGRGLFSLQTYANEYKAQHTEFLYGQAKKLISKNDNVSAADRIMALQHLTATVGTTAVMVGVGRVYHAIYKALRGGADPEKEKSLLGIPKDNPFVEIAEGAMRTGLGGSQLDMVGKAIIRDQLPAPVATQPAVELIQAGLAQAAKPNSKTANKKLGTAAYANVGEPILATGAALATSAAPGVLKVLPYAAMHLVNSPAVKAAAGEKAASFASDANNGKPEKPNVEKPKVEKPKK